MKTIENREDLAVLVSAFYAKIREDELLGPIFNRHLKGEQWDEHLGKLTDFWETTLFGIAKFKGSPTKKHAMVDKTANYSITPTHFGKWVQLWFETIDELYEGVLADKARQSARKMSTGQYLAIWHSRPENTNEKDQRLKIL